MKVFFFPSERYQTRTRYLVWFLGILGWAKTVLFSEWANKNSDISKIWYFLEKEETGHPWMFFLTVEIGCFYIYWIWSYPTTATQHICTWTCLHPTNSLVVATPPQNHLSHPGWRDSTLKDSKQWGSGQHCQKVFVEAPVAAIQRMHKNLM